MATKAQIQAVRAECAKLHAELAQYTGSVHADHALRMIEGCAESECLKRDGYAWHKMVRDLLEARISSPQHRTLRQISPETKAWGGFLSHDVSCVEGPSLRDDPDWARGT